MNDPANTLGLLHADLKSLRDELAKLPRTEDVQELRKDVRELRDEFQKAKGSLALIKWAVAASGVLGGLWWKGGHGGWE